MAKYNQKKEVSKPPVNYLNRDFVSLKKDLINYAKSYFPNSYNDFNETSPGMMLMEMSAYVGDVLNFYIDQQFKEMVLPTTEERSNMINLANTLGYKTKATVPAFVKLQFKQTVDAIGPSTDRQPDYGELMIFDKGLRVQSSTDSTVFFETLEILDFTVTGSAEEGDNGPQPLSVDGDGFVDSYSVQKTVIAISGTTKKLSFNVKSPKEFLKLTLPDTNVISILDVKDSSNNTWYEVDYLAQDKVFTETRRADPYSSTNVPVTNELNSTMVTEKRFITEVDENNKTSLVFGNGVMRSQFGGEYLEDVFYENQEINSVITNNLPSSLDPAGSLTYKSLGESPSNTTIVVTYRVGGGLKSNLSSNDLTTITEKKLLNNITSDSGNDASTVLGTLNVNNDHPSRGGSDKESLEEIRERAKATFKSQGRCVTAEDYESRILAMPARFGNIAKVLVQRKTMALDDVTTSNPLTVFDFDNDGSNGGAADKTEWDNIFTSITAAGDGGSATITAEQLAAISDIGSFIENLPALGSQDLLNFKNLDIYLLSYDKNKNLVNTSNIIKTNIENYLEQFRLISDSVTLKDGFVVNFGIYFNVIAHDNINKSELKLRCIEELKKYFDIDNMKFNQVLYTSTLENILYGIDGIKVVKNVKITQLANNLGIANPLYTAGGPAVGQATGTELTGETDSTYGWAYPFEDFYEDGGQSGNGTGVILPPNVNGTPGVFELKNPYDNIKGVVE